LREIAGHKEFV